MSVDQEPTTGSKKPGLPFTIGQLGMWVFISTEIMLFAGIIAVYLVLRLTTIQSGWPTRADMHVFTESGITMTIFLVFSAICAWQSWIACNEDRPRAARLWLILTILLGLVFLGIKCNEYYEKYQLGLMPIPGENQIYETADYQYVSHVNERLRAEILDLESREPESLTAAESSRLDLLYDLKANMVEATARSAGRTIGAYEANLFMNLMAYQIYPHVETGKALDEIYEPERKKINRRLDVLYERLGLAEKRQLLIAEQLALYEHEIEQFNSLDGDAGVTEENENLKNWFGIKQQQEQDLAIEVKQLKSAIAPLQGREDNLSASFDGEQDFVGINEQHDLRLPVVIPNGQAWMSVYLLLTGMHAVHLIVGLIALLFWLPQRLVSKKSGAFYVTCMYWQFVDAMWLAIFWFIYL